MILTGILTTLLIWCLFFGRIASLPLSAISILCGLVLCMLCRHNHGGTASIESIAARSKLNNISPILKVWTCFALLAISVCSGVEVGLFLSALAFGIQLYFGKLRLHEYLSLLALPLNFLLLSVLPLLFEWSMKPFGLLDLGLFGGWFCVTIETQARTILVVSRAFGALSSLYLLSLSTPLHEIIGVMLRARIPSVVTDLMYLIHRYLFLLLDLHSTMRCAAKSRLGFQGYSNSIHSTGMIYSNLFIGSFRQANASFDAMESRCFVEGISFMERKKAITVKHFTLAILLLGIVGIVAILGELT